MLNIHLSGSYNWEQYKIYTINSFQNVNLLKMKDENFYNEILPPTGNLKFLKMSDPGNPYTEPWVESSIDWCRWHRVEASIYPRGDKTFIHLFIDGRLVQEWMDDDPMPWEGITSADILIGDFQTGSNIEYIDLDNLVIDNAFASKSVIEGDPISDKFQQFVSLENIENKSEFLGTGISIMNQNQMVRVEFDPDPSSIEIISPQNLHDYNLNLTMKYNIKGTEKIWLRLNASDYQVDLPGQDGFYDLIHTYGYLIQTDDGFRNINISKVLARFEGSTLNCTQELGSFELIPADEYLEGAPIRLRFSIYGSLIDIYANGRLAFSLKDDLTCSPDPSIKGVNFGTTKLEFEHSDLIISDISIDTDYYFWSRKGNKFMYRGQEAVPVGLNAWPHKYSWARDIYDYVNNDPDDKLKGLEDLELRLDKANEAGARVIRMVLISGGYRDQYYNLHHGVGFSFTLDNMTLMAKDFSNVEPITTTISAEGFTDYINEMIKRARERDIFLLPALRHGSSEI